MLGRTDRPQGQRGNLSIRSLAILPEDREEAGNSIDAHATDPRQCTGCIHSDLSGAIPKRLDEGRSGIFRRLAYVPQSLRRTPSYREVTIFEGCDEGRNSLLSCRTGTLKGFCRTPSHLRVVIFEGEHEGGDAFPGSDIP